MGSTAETAGGLMGGVPGIVGGWGLDQATGNGSGESMNLQNPGNTHLWDTNPDLYKINQDLQGNQNAFANGAYKNIMDPHFYDQMMNNQIGQQNTSIANQYARAGLANSSNMLGAQSAGEMNTRFGFQKMQFGQQMQATNEMARLSGQQGQNIMAGQNQFAGFQGQELSQFMHGQDSQNAMLMSLIGAGGKVGGAIAGGGMGGGGGGMDPGMGAGMGDSYGGGGGGGYQMMPGYYG